MCKICVASVNADRKWTQIQDGVSDIKVLRSPRNRAQKTQKNLLIPNMYNKSISARMSLHTFRPRTLDIIEYITAKTKERVFLEKIDIKRDTSHKAYKFFVSPNNLPLFLDKNIWPQGIVFRKFVRFQYRHAIGTRSENGKHEIING